MFARSLPLLVAVMCFSACGAERKREKEYRQAISKEHQFLYVHAADGLVLRKAPGKDSEKLGIIPRDTTPLTVIEPADPKYRYVAERTGSFELSGQWVKVRTAKGQEGYLFDGYLLPFPPVLDWPDSGITDIELAYSYVSRLSVRDTLSEPDLLEGYRQHYHDGAVCETKIYHGGTTIVFSIPASSLTPQQALVLFRPLWLRQSPDPIQTKEVPGGIFVSGDGGYGYLSITSKEGRVLVELGAAD